MPKVKKNNNAGHGHVWERPDGARAKCGGPALCDVCAKDLAVKAASEQVIPGIPNPPANNIPPKGIEAYQMFRDGNHWSVWSFIVKEDGAIETKKVLERELLDLARLKVGSLTIEAQMRYFK